MRLVQRSEERITVQDLDANETVRIGKQEEISMDENEAMHRDVNSHFLMTDGRLISSVNEIGPQCGIKSCVTRLTVEHNTCCRCDRPICKNHSKKFQNKDYCRFCRWIEIFKGVFWWFVSLFRFIWRKSHE